MYTRALLAHPIATKAVTAAVLAGLGDAIAQRTADRRTPTIYDPGRSLLFATWGALSTPVLHGWYRLLGARLRRPLTRLIADQALFAPLGTMGLLAFVGCWEPGGGVEAARRRVVTQTLPVLRANYVFWPAWQFVNFTVVPAPFQVLFVNVGSLVWVAWLSRHTHSPPAGSRK